MNLHYHLIQYQDDPFSAEGRNVAVLAHDGSRAHLRALGMEKYQFQPVFFRALSRKARDSAWVYREWIEWFRYLINNEGKNPATLQEELHRLTSIGGLVVAGEGIMEGVDYFEVESAMDQLFQRLVKIPTIPPLLAFEEALEHAVKVSEIYYREGFMENAEIEMISDDEDAAPIKLEFEFMLLAPHWIGFKTLRFKGVSAKTLDRQVARIVSTFDAAVRTGLLDRDRCVVLCDSLTDKSHGYLSDLTAVARVIDIIDESAPAKIHRMV